VAYRGVGAADAASSDTISDASRYRAGRPDIRRAGAAAGFRVSSGRRVRVATGRLWLVVVSFIELLPPS